MKLKIGYLAENTGKVFNAHILDTKSIMEKTGYNTGNMAFWYTASKLFEAELQLFHFNSKPEDIKDKVDLLFFPSANWLNATSNLHKLADIVEKCDLPCVVVGLGAQSEDNEKIVDLNEGTIRFLKEVSKRTPYLCIRGEYTQKVCEHYSIKNTKILGCPSILLNGNKKLGATIEAKMTNDITKIAVHASAIKGSLRYTERELVRLTELFEGEYIIQRPPELMKIILGEDLDDSEKKYISRVNKFLAPDKSLVKFNEYIIKKGNFFADIESWILHLRSFSHAIGTRIHGTVLSLSAEIPAVCITHDTRTKELAEVLNVPRIHYTEFEKYKFDLSELLNGIEFNGLQFDENRKYLAKQYYNLFEEIGIVPSKHLRSFL